MRWIDKVRNKKNIIFVGESGCGKTELALNCATELSQDYKNIKTVNLLDMDQTKGSFRARDHEEELNQNQVTMVCGEHFLDTPVVPPGVIRLLNGSEYINVLDVGGNEMGAITMGQFAEQIQNTDSVVFFVINPFRILSLDDIHISAMVEKIRDYGAFEDFKFIANPNMGEYTDGEIAESGLETLTEIAAKMNIEFEITTLPEWLKGEIEAKLPQGEEPIYIKRYLQYP